MIHTLLGIAAVIFVAWLLLSVMNIGGAFIDLLWILIAVAVIWWLVSYHSGRRREL